jgi:hypothetical protein
LIILINNFGGEKKNWRFHTWREIQGAPSSPHSCTALFDALINISLYTKYYYDLEENND